jgi:hypothetical protein
VALGGAGVALLALLVAWLAWRRLSAMRTELASLRADPALVAGVDPQAVRHVSVVRYDAFGDLGGQMSFSVALLDTAGDGVVISAINGRSDCRTYAKGIQAGVGAAELSPEEQQAVAAAWGRSGRGTTPGPSGRGTTRGPSGRGASPSRGRR